MLDGYICECMVSVININNGVIEPIGRYRNCNVNQTLKFGAYVKVREFLYTSPCYKYPYGIEKEKAMPVQH